jgi:integrase
MSRRPVQHLVRRGNGFQVRLPIPVELQACMDRRELRWSVRTGDRQLATRRVLNATLAFHHLCDKLRNMKNLTLDDARIIANQFYQDLVKSFKSPPPILHDFADIEDEFQEVIGDDAIMALDSQIYSRSFESNVTVPAGKFAKAGGFAMPQSGTEEHRALCEGVAKAQREFAKYASFRRHNGIDEYEVEDPLFSTASAKQKPVQLIAPNSSPLTLGEVLNIYVQAETRGMSDGKSSWSAKTTEAKKRSLDLFGAVVGLDVPVKNITTDAVRTYRDLVEQMRKHCETNLSNPMLMKASGSEATVHPKTARKNFQNVKTFLIWLEKEEYVEKIPGRHLGIKLPAKSAASSRRPWSSSELNDLFHSPTYAGFKNRTRRHLPGTKILRDSQFWFPILGLYTGARLSELLQAKRSDLQLDAERPFWVIQEEYQLKTIQSARSVPLHDDLLEFGFLEFVDNMKPGKSRRVLDQLSLGKSERLGQATSKMINRYFRSVGIVDPGLTFHSLRHSFTDAARNAKIPEAQIKQLIGHKDTSITAGYGAGASIETLADYVSEMDFGLSEKTRETLRLK